MELNFKETALTISLLLGAALTGGPAWCAGTEVYYPEKPSIRDVLVPGTPSAAARPDEDERPSGPGTANVEELDEKIVISWNGPKKGELLDASVKKRASAVAEYHVFKSTNPGLNFVVTAKVPANGSGHYRYEDFDLKNTTKYYYRIMICDTNGGLHPHIRQFAAESRDVTRPRRPRRPDAASGDGFVKLSWTPYGGDDFQEYQLFRSDGIEGESVAVARIRQAGLCQFVDTDIVNGKTYVYHLRILDRGGNVSRESDEIVGKPRDATAPAAPENLAAVPGNNSVTLSWKRPADRDVEFFRIYMHEGEPKPGAKFKLRASIAANDTHVNSRLIDGLSNGKIYYFCVSAVDFSGNESARSFDVRTSPVDVAPPRAPGFARATPQNAAVRVEWAEVPDSDRDLAGYRIYRRSSAFPKFVMVAEVSRPKASREQMFTKKKKSGGDGQTGFYPTIFEYIDGGLYNGMPYHYYVVAYDKKGNESKPSETVEGIPRDAAAPDKVEGLSAVSLFDAIELKWKKNRKDRDLLGYYVYRKAEDDEKYALVSEIKKDGQSSYLDAHVARGKKYHYRVAAFDESRNESIASEEAVTAARFPNQVSFSRAYIKNYPNTFCYSVNPNDLTVTHCKSLDNMTWSAWSDPVKLPAAPPNFGRMCRISAQRWTTGTLVYSYNPETLDLYFTSGADGGSFGQWQLLTNRIELPPNFGTNCHITFEKDEKLLWGFAYNPKTSSAYYTMSRNTENFLGWNLCGLKVEPPVHTGDLASYCITSDDRGFYLFAFDLADAGVAQSFCFDKKHWKAWYRFARNMKKPPNLEKNRKN